MSIDLNELETSLKQANKEQKEAVRKELGAPSTTHTWVNSGLGVLNLVLGATSLFLVLRRSSSSSSEVEVE